MIKILIFIWEELILYIFKTKIYNLLLNIKKRKLSKCTPGTLEDFYYLDLCYEDGHEILDNIFFFSNLYYKIDSFENDIPKLSSVALEQFASFTWLYNLKALKTKAARTKALDFVLKWCNYYHSYSESYWSPSILSDRIFAFITNYEFFTKYATEEEKIIICDVINKQIQHLRNAYKYTFSLNNLKVAKAMVGAYYFCNEHKAMLTTALDAYNNAIGIQILRDGGDISRNPEASLSNLEDILCIYYVLKDHIYHDLNPFRELIDKITVFIRSIKVPGGLPIFQGGSSSNNKKITYLLSLSKVSTATSSVLRYSKFIIVKQNNLHAIMDVGNSCNSKQSSMGSLELWYKNKKIFGSLDASLGNNIINTALINFGLIAKTNDNKFERLINDIPKYLKYERKEEDIWNILKIQYGDIDDLGFVYHSTIYLSKKDFACVIGEDLLTIKDIAAFRKSFAQVFLNIPLNINIQYYKYLSNKKGIVFYLDSLGKQKDQFVISSEDTKLLMQNMSYKNKHNNQVINSYNIIMKLDISQSIIKNFWNLQQVV